MAAKEAKKSEEEKSYSYRRGCGTECVKPITITQFPNIAGYFLECFREVV